MTQNTLQAMKLLALDLSDDEKRGLAGYLLDMANSTQVRPVLYFDDDRRIVRWDGGHCAFSAKAVLRYRLVRELYDSETGKLSAAEIGELLYDDDLKPWDNIRKLGSSTEELNLEPVGCPYAIEIEEQHLKILERSGTIPFRVQ